MTNHCNGGDLVIVVLSYTRNGAGAATAAGAMGSASVGKLTHSQLPL